MVSGLRSRAAFLARDGFTVVVNYAGKVAPAEALVAKIESAGGRAVAAQADIADPAAVARLFDTAVAAFGGVDVVVNNAGVMQLATIAESSDALFDRQIAINLKQRIQQRWKPRVLALRGRRPHHQHFVERDHTAPAHLRRLCRDQGSSRGDNQRAHQGVARPQRSPSTRSRRARPPPSCSSTASRRK